MEETPTSAENSGLTHLYYAGSDQFKLRVCAVINALVDAVNALSPEPEPEPDPEPDP